MYPSLQKCHVMDTLTGPHTAARSPVCLWQSPDVSLIIAILGGSARVCMVLAATSFRSFITRLMACCVVVVVQYSVLLVGIRAKSSRNVV